MDLELDIDIAAPADRVTAALLDFGGLARWHYGVDEVTVRGDGVGAVRTYTMGGEVFSERLDAIDDRGFSYTVIASPIPARGMVARCTVEAHDARSTRVRWTASLSAENDVEESFAMAATGVQQIALDLLKLHLEGTIPPR